MITGAGGGAGAAAPGEAANKPSGSDSASDHIAAVAGQPVVDRLAYTDRNRGCDQLTVGVERGEARGRPEVPASDVGSDHEMNVGGAVVGTERCVGVRRSPELAQRRQCHSVRPRRTERFEQRRHASIEHVEQSGMDVGLDGVRVESVECHTQHAQPDVGVDQPPRHRHRSHEARVERRHRIGASDLVGEPNGPVMAAAMPSPSAPRSVAVPGLIAERAFRIRDPTGG